MESCTAIPSGVPHGSQLSFGMSLTFFECLERPALSHVYDPDKDERAFTDPLGPSLLYKAMKAANARSQNDLPRRLVVCPEQVAEAYANAKHVLQQDQSFPQAASDDLFAYTAVARSSLNREVKHKDEGSAVKMDETEMVNVAAQAAEDYSRHKNRAARLNYYSRQSQPAIDLTIVSSCSSPDTHLVLFEHKARHLAEHALDGLRAFHELSETNVRLNFKVSEEKPAPMETIAEDQVARHNKKNSRETRLSKAHSILTKTVLYMLRDGARHGIISCHEQWVFVQIINDNRDVSISPVYQCTSTDPPLTGTLFALLLDALGLVPLPADRFASVPIANAQIMDQGATTHGEDNRTPNTDNKGTGKGKGRGKDSSAKSSKDDQTLIDFSDTSPRDAFLNLTVVFDYMRRPTPPPTRLSQSAIRDGLLCRRQFSANYNLTLSDNSGGPDRPPSPSTQSETSSDGYSRESNGSSSRDSSSHTSVQSSAARSPAVFVAVNKLFAEGSTAAIFTVHHNAEILCKIFGPEEGRATDRYAGDWHRDFLTEQAMYGQHLTDLQGSVVPKCYGAFQPAEGGLGFLLIENCGEQVGSGESFAQVPHADRCQIYRLAQSLASIGVLSDDVAARNIVRSKTGELRWIDFGQTSISDDLGVQRDWLGWVQEALELGDDDVR